ncbi:MAG: hypothetical protein ACK4ME_07355 [Fimbriimonadales bacterium]
MTSRKVCTGILSALMAAAAHAQWLWPPQSMLNDTSTLNLQVIRTWTVSIGIQQVQMSELRYNSWEYVNGQQQTIPIEAYYARPTSFNTGNTVYFSEFRLRRNFLSSEFWVTSMPQLPPNFRPRIRPMPNAPRLEGDVNGDDCVDDADLLMVLFNFGNGC